MRWRAGATSRENNMENTIINHQYQLLHQLGEGGTSFVYQALDLVNRQPVVIKLMKTGLTSTYLDDLIRFKREVEIVSALKHPNIINIFGTGEYDNRPYVVMEYLAGESLADFINAGQRLTIEAAVRMILQLAQTLSYIHHYGVIHRDIKPGNIYLTGAGKKSAIKLLDFGVSHLIELGAIKDRQLIAGTFGYMSPEVTGILNRKIDERSDLYSLGVVFYQLLTNALPFTGTEVQQILHQQAALIPPTPRELNPGIPMVLDAIIMKLLMKEPDQRYQSATGLIFDLQRFLQGETEFMVGERDQCKKLTYQTTKLIGRVLEIHRIKELLDQTRHGQGAVCLITGEAGIGKSRLVEELRADLYGQNSLMLKGRCLNHQNKTPYQPFRDIVDEYIHWFENCDGAVRERETARFRNCLGDLGQIVIQFNPRLEKVLGPAKPLAFIDPDRENKRFLMVLSSFFCQLTENGKPNLLFLDDLQWADEGTLDLLETIMWKVKESNLLILGTCRDNEPGIQQKLAQIESRAKDTGVGLEKIHLDSLDHEQINHMAANIFHTGPISSALTHYIHKKSHGNPFFAVHIIRELIENHALFLRENDVEIAWDVVQRMPVSSTIVDIILRRIENLAPEQVDLLSKASVIGREFDIMLLIRLSHLGKEKIVAMVDEFIALQLLDKSMERGRLLFAHDRIRDAFYHKNDNSQKQRIHLEIARAIEELKGVEPDHAIFELAHHFLEGADPEKALEYTWPAALKAKASYANEDAVKYYQKTIALLEQKGEKGNSQWIAACQDLMEIDVRIGRNHEAIALSQELLPLVNEPLARAAIYQKIGAGFFKLGERTQSEAYLRQGLKHLHYNIPNHPLKVYISIVKELFIHLVHDLFPALFHHPDGKPVRKIDREIVNTCIYLTWLYGLSDIKKYVNITLQMLNLSETRIGKSRELGIFLCSYAVIFGSIPLFKVSVKLHENALKILKELGNEYAISLGFQLYGFTLCWIGDYPKAIRFLENTSEKFQQIGDLWEEGSSWVHLGICYRRIGEYQKALRCLEADLKISRFLNDPWAKGFNLSFNALLQLETGAFETAAEMLKNAALCSKESKNNFIECLVIHVYGALELEKGNYDQAIVYLEEARKIYFENDLLKDYILAIFPLLAESYLKKAQNRWSSGKPSTAELKKIRDLCSDALKQTKAWPNYYGSSLRVAANCCYLHHQNRKAETYFQKAIEHTERINLKFETGKGYLEYGNFLQAIGCKNEAKNNWQRAYLTFQEIGAKVYLKKCAELCNFSGATTIPGDMTARNRLGSERRKHAMISTSRYISSILDIHLLLEKIMDSAMELVGAERGILLLNSEADSRNLEPKVVRKITTTEIDPQNIHISHHIISQVQKEQRSLMIVDALTDETLKNQDSVVLYGIRSVICSPIMLKGALLGVIYLDNTLVSGLFNDEDLEVLDLFANQAGVALENARLCQSLEQLVSERTRQLESVNRELTAKNTSLLTMNEQLREHAATVEELATMKERNRMATDVHDTIGHTLTLLLRLLELSKNTCRKDPAKSEIELGNAIQITREGLQEIRRSISGLMPERLATNHLVNALEQLIAGFQSSGVAVDFTIEGTGNLPHQGYYDVIYRTCQEAMTNAVRHGKAKNVAIILKFGPQQLNLFIVDDGPGCKKIEPGMGLLGMTQRVQSLHGRCQFFSDGESGFMIQVDIPIH